MTCILIIDDDDDYRATVREILEGCREFPIGVVEARNAIEAIDVAARVPPDLIIVDYFMPGMSGVRLVQVLGHTINLKFVPVIMLTSVNVPEMKKVGLAAGVSNWLVKPVTPLELLRNVRDLLEKRRR